MTHPNRTIPLPAMTPLPPLSTDRRLIGAYYLNAHMYTSVPRHVREDMAWIAETGTDFICVGILEQDLWAAGENIELIIEEAARANLRVMAVPSRWGGLTAGAPKVPSLFSVLHPHTWIQDEHGQTGFNPTTSGVISSIHWPETFQFFTESLDRFFTRHPGLAGLVIDEPKALQFPDHSPKARAVLGPGTSRSDHVQAAVDFYDRVLGHVRERHPDKLRLMFVPAQTRLEDIERCAAMRNVDYFGADGRAWDLPTDGGWLSLSDHSESGRGKVLLSGIGQQYIDAAHARGKKSLFLIENHNLTADMIDPMDRCLPDVLALDVDLVLYYYYPRNIPEPDRVMGLLRRHLLASREAVVGASRVAR